MAAWSSSLRTSGCAISISATARSASERPNRYAVPYSVITQCTSLLGIATASRGSSSGRIEEWPVGLREARAMIAIPSLDASAPRWNAGPVETPP